MKQTLVMVERNNLDRSNSSFSTFTQPRSKAVPLASAVLFWVRVPFHPCTHCTTDPVPEVASLVLNRLCQSSLYSRWTRTWRYIAYLRSRMLSSSTPYGLVLRELCVLSSSGRGCLVLPISHEESRIMAHVCTLELNCTL